jgi:hypothetical protein
MASERSTRFRSGHLVTRRSSKSAPPASAGLRVERAAALRVVMDETYEVAATRQAVTGHATYSDFREFKVTTSADIK